MVKESDALAEEDFIERLYFNLGYSYRKYGEVQKAIDSMNKILTINQTFEPALEALVSIYYAEKNKDDLTKLLETWVQNNPDDARRMSMLNQIRSPEFKFMDAPPQP
jgi:tetratricopeptide (TPR) repeat protein